MKVPKLVPHRIPIEGIVHNAVLLPSGRVCVHLTVAGQAKQKLVCFDLNGNRLWSGSFVTGAYTRATLRVGYDGQLWGGWNDQLIALREDGVKQKILPLALEAEERLGSFVCVPDGFLVSMYLDRYCRDSDSSVDLSPQVLRLDREGRVVWSTTLPVDEHHFEGIVEARAETGWEAHPKSAWRPRQWQADVYVHDPILLSGNRLLASYIDIGSGLGASYCLDATNGELLWRTSTLPFDRRAIAGHEQFLLGAGGYGMSSTQLRDGAGTVIQEWPCNGVMCVSESGQVIIGEQFNPRCRVVKLHPDGTVQNGPVVPGSYSSALTLTKDNQVLCWRGDWLLMIDSALKLHKLARLSEAQKYAPCHPVLLCPDGTLVLALYEHNTSKYEMWFVKTSFALQEDAPWPCVDGNVSGNPSWP